MILDALGCTHATMKVEACVSRLKGSGKFAEPNLRPCTCSFYTSIEEYSNIRLYDYIEEMKGDFIRFGCRSV